MTQLLVSVRNAHEARTAVEGGAHIIDAKEPNHGALGAVPPAQLADIAAVLVQHSLPLSVALGELADKPTIPAGTLRFAKVGLAGCSHIPDWQSQLAGVWIQLAGSSEPVAVIYADHEAAAAPSPNTIIEFAANHDRCQTVLIDTFDKRTGNIFHHLSSNQLNSLANRIHSHQMQLAVAGSLDACTIPTAMNCQADIIAVRGAACESARASNICKRRVQALVQLVCKTSA
ncbi:MAG: (5-formylfuran-3-yl)methyl phosphate synthase [Pirellulaceae bacterium]